MRMRRYHYTQLIFVRSFLYDQMCLMIREVKDVQYTLNLDNCLYFKNKQGYSMLQHTEWFNYIISLEELHLLYTGNLEGMSTTENFCCLSHHYLLSKSRCRSLKPNQEHVLFGNYI